MAVKHVVTAGYALGGGIARVTLMGYYSALDTKVIKFTSRALDDIALTSSVTGAVKIKSKVLDDIDINSSVR